VDRRPQQRLRRVSNRARIVRGTAGFRGAVSLAAALAVPHALDDGGPFPDRDVIVFITAGVVFVTITVQGLLLPAVVRWARLPRDTFAEQERRLAERLTTEEALAALPRLTDELGADPPLGDRLSREYARHLELLRADPDTVDEPVQRRERDYTPLPLAALAQKRTSLIRLRDEHRACDRSGRMRPSHVVRSRYEQRVADARADA
jgi:hypothetical protein